MKIGRFNKLQLKLLEETHLMVNLLFIVNTKMSQRIMEAREIQSN